jgi:hypothetical protein
MMKMRGIVGWVAIAVAAIGVLPLSAAAQEKSFKRQLIGTWMLTAWEQTLPDGRKVQRFGEHPKGLHVFLPNGRFFLMIARPDLPKIASNDSMNPTPEEAKALSVGTLAYYGTYTVNEKDRTITETLDASTFPNQLSVEQKRVVTAISATAMHFSNHAAVGGGQIELEWQRVK